MIGDDDWRSFFDPEEFGCELQMVLGGDVREVPGMLGAPRSPDQLRTGNRNQGGVRAKCVNEMAPLIRCQPNFGLDSNRRGRSALRK